MKANEAFLTQVINNMYKTANDQFLTSVGQAVLTVAAFLILLTYVPAVDIFKIITSVTGSGSLGALSVKSYYESLEEKKKLGTWRLFAH